MSGCRCVLVWVATLGQGGPSRPFRRAFGPRRWVCCGCLAAVVCWCGFGPGSSDGRRPEISGRREWSDQRTAPGLRRDPAVTRQYVRIRLPTTDEHSRTYSSVTQASPEQSGPIAHLEHHWHAQCMTKHLESAVHARQMGGRRRRAGRGRAGRRDMCCWPRPIPVLTWSDRPPGMPSRPAGSGAPPTSRRSGIVGIPGRQGGLVRPGTWRLDGRGLPDIDAGRPSCTAPEPANWPISPAPAWSSTGLLVLDYDL